MICINRNNNGEKEDAPIKDQIKKKNRNKIKFCRTKKKKLFFLFPNFLQVYFLLTAFFSPFFALETEKKNIFFCDLHEQPKTKNHYGFAKRNAELLSNLKTSSFSSALSPLPPRRIEKLF